jgi:hypothetical protein
MNMAIDPNRASIKYPYPTTHWATEPREKELDISMNWVTLENQAFSSSYQINPDGILHPFISNATADEVFADTVKSFFTDALCLEIHFLKMMHWCWKYRTNYCPMDI